MLKPGMKEEYKRRHDAIWPEMVALLKAAGIRNYTIWNVGDELFGYYECEKGLDYAASVQAEVDCASVSLTAGQMTLPVTVRVPSSSRIFAVGSYTVQSEITAK